MQIVPGAQFRARLDSEARTAGLELEEDCLQKLAAHYTLLARWSRSVRLVGSLDPDVVIRRHILESLALAPWIHERRGALLDIGSGNGYPAIPVKCALPEMRLAMMEPTLRKSLFLEQVIAELGLEDATVIRARVDRPGDLARYGRWDCISMRAVAAIPTVMAGAPAALRPHGRILLLVGEAGRREVAASLGDRFRLLTETRLGESEGSYLVVVEIRT